MYLQIWDIDGTIVSIPPNVKDILLLADKQKVYPEQLDIISRQEEVGDIVRFITGRKKSQFKEITISQIGDRIVVYYPEEEFSYANYGRWKVNEIIKMIKFYNLNTNIYEDDEKVCNLFTKSTFFNLYSKEISFYLVKDIQTFRLKEFRNF